MRLYGVYILTYRYTTYNYSNKLIQDSNSFRTKIACENALNKELEKKPKIKFAVIYNRDDDYYEDLAIRIADVKLSGDNLLSKIDEIVTHFSQSRGILFSNRNRERRHLLSRLKIKNLQQDITDEMCYYEYQARCEVIVN